jgi:hypothetical protein
VRGALHRRRSWGGDRRGKGDAVLRAGATIVARSLLALLAMLLLMLTAMHRSHAQTPFFSEVTYWRLEWPTPSGSERAIIFSLTEDSWGGGVRARILGIEPIPTADVRIGDDFLSNGYRIGQSITGRFILGNGRSREPCPSTFDVSLGLYADRQGFDYEFRRFETRMEGTQCVRIGNPVRTSGTGRRIDWPTGQPWQPQRPPDVVRAPPPRPQASLDAPKSEITASTSGAAPSPGPAVPEAVPATDNLRWIASQTLFGGLLAVAFWLWFSKGTAARSVARLLVRLVRWLTLAVALVMVVLTPLHVLGQHPEWRQVEGSVLHWVHGNITDSIAAALNKSAPYCGTTLLIPAAWPRCQASLTTMIAAVESWISWSLSGSWRWLSTNSGGVLPWIGWLFGAIWSWVSTPFVWVFGSMSDLLWWFVEPFVQFFWLVYTIIAWIIWLAVQLVVWVAWLLWHLGVWVLWLIGQALYYAALGLTWFAINLGNYVIALTAVLVVILSAGLNDNRFGKWMNKRLPIGRMFQAFIDAHGTAAKERRKQEEEARQRAQREAQERKRQEHPSGVTSDAFDKAKAAFGIHNTTAELNEDDMRKLYRSLRAKAHPDSLGGSHDQFLKIDAAWIVICTRMFWQQK